MYSRVNAVRIYCSLYRLWNRSLGQYIFVQVQVLAVIVFIHMCCIYRAVHCKLYSIISVFFLPPSPTNVLLHPWCRRCASLRSTIGNVTKNLCTHFEDCNRYLLDLEQVMDTQVEEVVKPFPPQVIQHHIPWDLLRV